MQEFQEFYTRIKSIFPEEPDGPFTYTRAPGESITIDMRGGDIPPAEADVRKIATETLGGLEYEISPAAGTGVGTMDGSIVIWLEKGYYLSFSPENFFGRRVFMNVGRRGNEPDCKEWKERCINLLTRYFNYNL